MTWIMLSTLNTLVGVFKNCIKFFQAFPVWFTKHTTSSTVTHTLIESISFPVAMGSILSFLIPNLCCDHLSCLGIPFSPISSSKSLMSLSLHHLYSSECGYLSSFHDILQYIIHSVMCFGLWWLRDLCSPLWDYQKE